MQINKVRITDTFAAVHMSEIISSPHNPKIKNLKKLEKASERREQNLFVIEGLRETVLAYRAGYEIKDLFVCNELLKKDGQYALTEIENYRTRIQVTKQVYESVSYRDTTEGVIATAVPKNLELQHLKLNNNPLILVIESVEKPGNLGAMLRTADAAGVDAVIICDARTDVYNPNVVRSSIGTVFTNALAVCETAEAIAFLKEKQITTYAAELTATESHFQKNFKKGTALVVGAEATGLSTEWMNAADEKIKIPMRGKIDSLNVSVSAGILLFEALRQREV